MRPMPSTHIPRHASTSTFELERKIPAPVPARVEGTGRCIQCE